MLLAVCVLVARASGHDDLFDQHTALDIALYKDPSQPVDVRTADLLSRMTLDEKVAQLTCVRCVCARPHAYVSAPFMHCSVTPRPGHLLRTMAIIQFPQAAIPIWSKLHDEAKTNTHIA
jgi:hypothetical protein